MFPFSKIIVKWNTLRVVFSSPHYLALNSTWPRNQSEMTSCVYTPAARFRVTWQQWLEKTKNRFCMRILNMFLFFQSDLWLSCNIDLNITRFFFKICSPGMRVSVTWLLVIISQQLASESRDNNDYKRQKIDFCMRILNMFSFFQSGVWLGRNIDFKITWFFSKTDFWALYVTVRFFTLSATWSA